MELETASEIDRSAAPPAAPSYGFVVTSVVASAVGLAVAVLVDHLGVAIGGALAGRQPALFHNRVLLMAPGSDLAFAGGVIASLAAGAFFLLLYPGSHRYDAARIMTLWLVLHSFGLGFSQLLLIPFRPDGPSGLAWASLGAPGGLDLVPAALGGVGLLVVALASAPAFLAYARRHAHISTSRRRVHYVAKLAVIPGIAGPLLTVPFFLPDGSTGFTQGLPLAGLFTVAALVTAAGTKTVRATDTGDERGFSLLPLGWLLFLLVVFQVVLTKGLLIPPDLTSLFVDP